MSRNKWAEGIVLSLLFSVTACTGGQGVTIPRPGSPAYKAAQAQAEETGQLDQIATSAVKAKNYAAAEAAARKSLAAGSDSGIAQEVLACALNAEGKTQEALQAYKTLSDEDSNTPRIRVPYAALLLKMGHWAQAVAIYNQVLPELGEPLLSASHFSAAMPQPKELALTLLLAQGAVDDNGAVWSTPEKAMGEFTEARRLAPNLDLTSYFYYYGWWSLYPDDPNKTAGAPAAKAALRKAVNSDDPAVKKAADNLVIIEAIHEANNAARPGDLQQKANPTRH